MNLSADLKAMVPDDGGVQNMITFNPLLVDAKTACEMLGCQRTLLFQYLREGLLQRCKLGRKTVIPMASIKAFAEGRAS